MSHGTRNGAAISNCTRIRGIPKVTRSSPFRHSRNHCVLFETNEYSWHGFHAVSVPDGKEISRKSFTIYMYTKERPLNEIADKHGTIYVPRPMPGHLKPGHTLTAADVGYLQNDY